MNGVNRTKPDLHLRAVWCENKVQMAGLALLQKGARIGAYGACVAADDAAGVRANAQQPRLVIGVICILIFAKALVSSVSSVGWSWRLLQEGKGKGLCMPYGQ
mmetsp:Transcript_31748/g.62396  ORF Transcript_31748/g.62396 Transcript_31748/m.62396 type:complete len:103 (-) Transcript_31748:42-350(-)